MRKTHSVNRSNTIPTPVEENRENEKLINYVFLQQTTCSTKIHEEKTICYTTHTEREEIVRER